jgi:hypothetical protein
MLALPHALLLNRDRALRVRVSECENVSAGAIVEALVPTARCALFGA